MQKAGIFAASRIRRQVTEAPTVASHRYWRILFNATVSNGRCSMAEVEFLDRRYYRRKDGTFTASGEASGAQAAVYATDGEWNGSTSSGFWSSNNWNAEGDVWLKLDTGAGQECNIEGVMLTRGNGFATNAFDEFVVQWSDDDSTWTEEWRETGVEAKMLAASTRQSPVLFTNPNVSEFEPTPSFDTTDLRLWLKAYDGAFTDEFTTQAGDMDLVRTMTNHATGSAIEIRQDNSSFRPRFRTGGVSGLPYLEFPTGSDAYFDDIAYVVPSSSTQQYPGHVGFFGEPKVPTGDEVIAVLGDSASAVAKHHLYFREPANEQISWQKSAVRLGNVPASAPLIFAGGVAVWNRFYLAYEDADGDGFSVITGSSTFSGGAKTTAQLFRNTATASVDNPGGYYRGKVYELIIRNESAVDAGATNEARNNALYIKEYLKGRKLYGVP